MDEFKDDIERDAMIEALRTNLAGALNRLDALEGWRKSICVDASGALCPGPEPIEPKVAPKPKVQPEPDKEEHWSDILTKAATAVGRSNIVHSNIEEYLAKLVLKERKRVKNLEWAHKELSAELVKERKRADGWEADARRYSENSEFHHKKRQKAEDEYHTVRVAHDDLFDQAVVLRDQRDEAGAMVQDMLAALREKP